MRRIQFNEFEIDLDLYSLARNGEALHIGPRALDLLICLIENRDRVVSRDFLMREVWKAKSLSDATIPTAVMEIRRALGDSVSSPIFVESTRGRGYRFLPDLTPAPKTQTLDEHSSRKLPYVGRVRELEALSKVVRDSASKSSGRLVLVRGQAGIGKTRFLQEFLLSVASSTSLVVLESRCPNRVALGPLWPLKRILEQALAQDCLSGENRLAAARLAQAPPEDLSTDRMNGVTPQKNGQLHEWAQIISTLPKASPTLIAIEDLHWADPDTLTVLSWVLAEFTFLPLVIVTTQRAGSAAAPAQLHQLSSDNPGAVRFDLAPLSQPEVKSLLPPLYPDRDSASEILTKRTSGNPFYLTYLVREYLNADPSLPISAIAEALPSDIREILPRILSDLSAKTRRCLLAASAAGETFHAKTISRATGIEIDAAIKSLDSAISSQLIREEGSEYVFVHSLVRDALYNSLDVSERKKVHLDLAQVFKSRSAGDRDIEQVAEHLYQALPLGSEAEAVEYMRTAGLEALDRMEYPQAQEFLGRALEVSQRFMRLEKRLYCTLLLDMSIAMLQNGNPDEARDKAIQAAECAREISDNDLFAECALALYPSFKAIAVGEFDLTLSLIIEEALSKTSPDRIGLRSRLLATLSHAVRWSGDDKRSPNLATEAVSLARESECEATISLALAARSDSLNGPIFAAERSEICAELVSLAAKNTDHASLLVHQTRLITALLEQGKTEQAEAVLSALSDCAKRADLPHYTWYPESIRMTRRLMNGDLEESKEVAQLAETVQQRRADENVAQCFTVQHIFRQVENNQGSSLIPQAAELSQLRSLIPSWRAVAAWLLWDSSQPKLASKRLSSITPHTVHVMNQREVGGAGIALLGEVAAHIGTKAQKQFFLEMLVPLKDYFSVVGYSALYLGSFSRPAGLLASSLGRNEDAIRLLRQSVECEIRTGATLWQAYSEIDLAKVLLAAAPASSESQEAIEAAGETTRLLGTARVVRRFEELARYSSAHSTRPPDHT